MNESSKSFDPDEWTGETDALLPLKADLESEDFCSELFMSKHEAFWKGYAVASLELGTSTTGGDAAAQRSAPPAPLPSSAPAPRGTPPLHSSAETHRPDEHCLRDDGGCELINQLRELSWGSLADEWYEAAEALGMARRVTQHALKYWEWQLEGRYPNDEFDAAFEIGTNSDPFPVEVRLAQVARLIDDVAIDLGIGSDGRVRDHSNVGQLLALVIRKVCGESGR